MIKIEKLIHDYIKRDDEKQKIIIYDKFFSKYFLTPICRIKENIVGAARVKSELTPRNMDSTP